ncbi:hypothetical protein LguiA_028284 [Lonicera macranthoides]
MSNYKVAELTWENGHPAMHGLGGVFTNAPVTKGTPTSTWCRPGDDSTLESIVHQATAPSHKLLINNNHHQITHKKLANISSTAASSSGKWTDTSGYQQINPSEARKRMRSESNQCGKKSSKIQEECVDLSACASASATFSQDNDMTMMTWPSFESPRSSKNPITATDEDHPAFRRSSEKVDDEEWKNNKETIRSHSTRRSRAAAIHNQSERKRRDKINQKMKALQKLVPNASKTDKASMLDEVIEYLKQLQAQVQMMNLVRNMPQMMMMPLGMQQQQQHLLLQMSMLARMGMGSNVPPQSLPHFVHPNPTTTTTPTFMPSPFMVPPLIQKHLALQSNPNQAASNPFNDPYCAFLAQSMNNIDMYNKMAAIYKTSESSHPSK